MPEPEPETLTQLVAERVGDDGDLTLRALEARSIDPETGYKPSHSTVWKIAKGESIKVSPEIVRALAAGLGLPPTRVQAAAAYQYTGYTVTPVGEGVAVHAPGAKTDRAQQIARRLDEEETGAQASGDNPTRGT